MEKEDNSRRRIKGARKEERKGGDGKKVRCEEKQHIGRDRRREERKERKRNFVVLALVNFVINGQESKQRTFSNMTISHGTISGGSEERKIGRKDHEERDEE